MLDKIPFFQFMEVVEDLSGSGSMERVCDVLNDAGTSDYLVVYLRLIISAHLQKNAEFFACFIEGGRTVEEFVKQVSRNQNSFMYIVGLKHNEQCVKSLGLAEALNGMEVRVHEIW